MIESDEDKKIILKQMLIDMRKRVFDVDQVYKHSFIGYSWNSETAFCVWEEN